MANTPRKIRKKSTKKTARRSAKKSIVKRHIGELKYPCIQVTQGSFNFYLFKAKAKEINNVVEVNRRKPDKDEGYQRLFSPARVNAIAKYYKSGKSIPSAILVSFDNARYENDTILIPKKQHAGWVIDGQHRLLGAVDSEIEVQIPIIAFIKLPLEEQIQQFVTINKEAKGVPSSLYIDLLKKLPKSKTPSELAKERVANIGQQLNSDESSPFYGKIVILTSPKRGEISLTNFARKVQNLVLPDKGLLGRFDLGTQVKILSNYFNGIRHVFVEEFERDVPIIYQTVGFGAFMNVFPLVFTHSIAQFQGITLQNVIDIFKEMEDFQFDEWRQSGSGTQAENNAAKDIEVELAQICRESGEGHPIKV